ncbi:unannotated protein [freshwater metagenome]|uniref:Unannotated protein n=1 Tax=freshwater metagenome TaxID=449393 RepID=A0A6J7JKQ3_9ZZZZ|nr:hypothetical protein [Actinomycetota bacterium]
MLRLRHISRTAASIAVAAVVVVIAIIAFVALRPGDEPPVAQRAPAAAPQQTATQPAPARAPARIVIKNGAPVGGVRELTVPQGGAIRFRVESPEPVTVHLHGYDIEQPAAAGAPVVFNVEATITGVFEVELEELGVQIAKVSVEP